MIGQAPLMSSARTGDASKDEWRTPKWLFDRCVIEFGEMQLDAAASKDNALCPSHYSEEHSALDVAAHWSGNVWCNPPYSMLKQFAEKALMELESHRCTSVTFLIPARTDTKAFQKLANSVRCRAIVFLAGRVKFEPGTQSAPFPSAIVHLSSLSIARPLVAFEDWRTK